MNLTRCPICHCKISLDALVQDDAGRELLALFAKLPAPLAGPLVSYLGLFRPEKRDLANDRALSLAQEALALESDRDLLKAALVQAVEAAREKALAGQWKTPRDHGWLKAFVKDTRTKQGVAPKSGAPRQATEEKPARRRPDDVYAKLKTALHGG